VRFALLFAAALALPAQWVNAPKPGTVLPAGVTHQTYRSASMQCDVGYLVYLPPDYNSAPARRYPVIYNLHGAGGNEWHGFEEARPLGKGIREGKWPAMIMVFPNGGKTTFYKDSADGKSMAETTFIRELIPHIDGTYRTIAERKGRAIEGFSMGGRGSTRLAMKYPELFISLFNQAGNVMHTSTDPLTDYLGPDRAHYFDNDSYLLLKKNLQNIKDKLRIQVWCGTRDDTHITTVRQYHQALLDSGVDHTYMEIEDLAHVRTEMIRRYEAIWFDYHVESFRRAGALPR
jgi:enterochelin esterase-like enzyme